jgi:hypothetical protein
MKPIIALGNLTVERMKCGFDLLVRSDLNGKFSARLIGFGIIPISDTPQEALAVLEQSLQKEENEKH